MSAPVNIFLAGVGGQGLVLVNRLLARAAILSGLDAKSTDTHGLAMRGGGIMGTLRIGEQVETSIFAEGEGDFLLGLEPLEALRHAHNLRRGGLVVTASDEQWPAPILLERSRMPEDWRQRMVDKGLRVVAIPAMSLALQAGSNKMVNVVMAGALSPFLDLPLEQIEAATEAQVPPGTYDKNLRALLLGREAARAAEVLSRA